jgi:SpoVK/Ycf46/Vps4 family AAA+-type ATPase
MNDHDCSQPNQQWTVLPNNTYQTCGPTTQRLPAGAYTLSQDCYGRPLFQKRQSQLDDLIDFSDSLAARTLEEMEEFWTRGAQFARYGFLHRRGYLFYGKQGGGKSSLIHLIIDRVIQADQVAFWCEYPHAFVPAATALREVEPDRPMVCIFEDIDAIIQNYGDCVLLQWLDGHHQVDRVINLATTNYPERLDPRIISRPRRFDRVVRIDMPGAQLREAFFARKVPQQSPAERARWVELTDGLPFSHLSEVVISVLCMGNGLEESVARLRKLDENLPTSSEFNEPHVNGVAEQMEDDVPA